MARRCPLCFSVPMNPPALYRAEGLDPLVAISDDGRLMATLGEVMVGWNIVPAGDASPGAEISLRVEQGDKGWTFSGVTFDKPETHRDPVGTACCLLAALFKVHTLSDHKGRVPLVGAPANAGNRAPHS